MKILSVVWNGRSDSGVLDAAGRCHGALQPINTPVCRCEGTEGWQGAEGCQGATPVKTDPALERYLKEAISWDTDRRHEPSAANEPPGGLQGRAGSVPLQAPWPWFFRALERG